MPKDVHSWVEGCELEQWRGLLKEKMESCFQENEERFWLRKKLQISSIYCKTIN